MDADSAVRPVFVSDPMRPATSPQPRATRDHADPPRDGLKRSQEPSQGRSATATRGTSLTTKTFE